MKKIIILLCFLSLEHHRAFAQNLEHIQIRGVLKDTSLNPLGSATILLLKKSDSSTIKQTISNETGSFNFKKIVKNDYLVKLTYLGFNEKIITIRPSNHENLDLGIIIMAPLSKGLSEVIVKTIKIPISINGDTTVYNADSFKTQPGAIVEDLLRRLPGIQINSDGSIIAHGKEVKKITIDGQSFFLNDPRIATKNLSSDAIEKIQVFNDKTENSIITGIDDGNNDKAINLKLKESYKKNMFGKTIGGIGLKNEIGIPNLLKTNMNKISSNQQFSIIGLINNTNNGGITWGDYQTFAGKINLTGQGDGTFGFGGSRIIPSGDEQSLLSTVLIGQFGIQKNYTAGFNYNSQKTKSKLNTSYYFNQNNQFLRNELISQKFIKNESITTKDKSNRTTINGNHVFNYRYETKFDSSNSIIFFGNIIMNVNKFENKSLQNIYKDPKTDLSKSDINNNDNSTGQTINSTLIYKYKFSKKGRGFAGSLSFSANIRSAKSLQVSSNDFFDNNSSNSQWININQIQKSTLDKNTLKGSLIFLEPIKPSITLETFYNFGKQNSSTERPVFDIVSDKLLLNDTLSRYSDNAITYNRFGSALRVSLNRINFSVGGALQDINQAGDLFKLSNNTLLKKIARNDFRIIPNVNINVNLKNKHLYGGYSVNIIQPKFNELQPFVENINPFYLTFGNPNLLPSLGHDIILGYNSFNPTSFLNFFISSNYTKYINQIIYSQDINLKTSVLISKPINISGGEQLNTSIGIGVPIIKSKASINLNGNLTQNKNPVFINSLLNLTKNNNYNIGIKLDLTPSQNFTFLLNTHWGFSKNTNSDNSIPEQNLYSFRYNGDLNIKLFSDFYLSSSFDYRIYKNEQFNINTRIPLLNTSIYKLLGKSKKMEIRIAGFDLLKKNVGFGQSFYQNSLSQIKTQTLSRYFLLMFTYNLKGSNSNIKK